MQVRATFHIGDHVSKTAFQSALRKIYVGTAEDQDVSFVLDSVTNVVCGHDPDVMREVQKKRKNWPNRRAA